MLFPNNIQRIKGDEKMKIVYAHTDSLYIPVPSIERAQEVREILNTHIQDEVFPNVMGLETHPMDLEFEKFYSVLGVGCKKNTNAGFISWKDGVYLHEPEFFATGFVHKRVAESTIAKNLQKEIIKMWINQNTQEEITSRVKEVYNDVLNGEINKIDLVKRSRIKDNRLIVKCKCKKRYEVEYVRRLLKVMPDYLCDSKSCNRKLKDCTTVEDKRPTFGGGFAGVLYYNEHVNPRNKLNDSFYHMKCIFKPEQPNTFTSVKGETKKAGYIAVRNLDELEDYDPDFTFLAEAEVIKKVKPIYDAMNWDTYDIKKDMRQKVLDEWF